jgi:hypothetical protein
MPKQNSQKGRGVVDTITAIDTPLRFFALALISVETIIGVLSFQKPTEAEFMNLSYLATFIFIFVVSMVVLLVFRSPQNLLAARVSDLAKWAEKAKELTQEVKDRQNAMDLTIRKSVDIIEAVPKESPAIARAMPPKRG